MIKTVRAVCAAGAVLSVVALGGCGGSSHHAAPAADRTLPPPPATVPADYTTVAALVRQLAGVAHCTPNGPQSAVCTLVTTTTNTAQIVTASPFQAKVFATPAQATAYLAYVHGANLTYAKDGSPVRQALTGPHWVVTPQVDITGLAQRLRPYLGGTITQ